jgi:hypothetical protein
MSQQAFRPVDPSVVSWAVSRSANSTSSSVALLPNFRHIRVVNNSTTYAYIRWGVGAQTAIVTTDMILAPGGAYIFAKGQADTLAAITSGSDTSVINITHGEQA